MRTLLITFSAIAIFTGCSEKPPVTFSNDTEAQEWGNQATIKERPNAHSGKCVSVIDSTNAYSLLFHKKIQDITTDEIKSVTFTYWVFFKNFNTKGASVLSVDFEGKNMCWQGPIIEDKVKELNKWVQISQKFVIPNNIDPKSYLTLYVWNGSKEEILVDDFQIKVN